MQPQVFNVKDGARKLTVHGVLLSASSSYENGKTRWVEFELLRANSGVYVIYRVGKSSVFHSKNCRKTSNGSLDFVDPMSLTSRNTPCHFCKPTLSDVDGVYPEIDKHFTLVCQTAEGVLDAVMMYDTMTDSKYFTNVARRLIEDAAELDEGVYRAYYEQESVIK